MQDTSLRETAEAGPDGTCLRELTLSMTLYSLWLKFVLMDEPNFESLRLEENWQIKCIKPMYDPYVFHI